MTFLHLLSALAISTQAAADDALVGRFTLDPAASDDPAVAVDDVIGNVRRMARGRVRSRLTPLVTPPETLEIEWDDEAYTIVDPEGRKLSLVPGGDPVEVEAPDGQRARMSAELDGETLRIRTEAPRASRVQHLTPTESGLEMTIVLELEIASEPITLAFRYERETDR